MHFMPQLVTKYLTEMTVIVPKCIILFNLYCYTIIVWFSYNNIYIYILINNDLTIHLKLFLELDHLKSDWQDAFLSVISSTQSI